MNKNIILTITAAAVITSAMCGCSKAENKQNTVQNTVTTPAEEAAVITVISEQATIPGHVLYVSSDNSFFIQLPEGHTINDIDPENITISLPGTFATPDMLTITKTTTATAIYSESQLYEMLANDNTIDITSFHLLKTEDGAYKGYQYDYVSYADPQLKGITRTYFSADGSSAYVVDATINNGGDEINVYNIKVIVETFINHL